ncbi:MAG: flagellar basal body rod C-terminal domain-containing protein [Candidatus Sulfotelmatobacter sp.]
MDISAIALQGMNQASAQLNATAAEIAGASSANGSSPDVVNLSEEMVALMSAQNLFSENVVTLKTADQIQKSLVDLTA